MLKLVMSVKEIKLSILKSDPSKLGIYVIGIVPTSGWQNPELAEHIHVLPPADGIYDFDFIAESPQGPVLQVISPILVSHVWEGDVEKIKGVRIHYSGGEKVEMLDTAETFDIVL